MTNRDLDAWGRYHDRLVGVLLQGTTVSAWLGALFIAFGAHGVWSDPSLEQTVRDETLAVTEHTRGIAEGLIEFLNALELPDGGVGEQLTAPLSRGGGLSPAEAGIGDPDAAARAVETTIRSAERTTGSITRVIAAVPLAVSLPVRTTT